MIHQLNWPQGVLGWVFLRNSGRVSHALGLRGPCFTIDTACSCGAQQKPGDRSSLQKEFGCLVPKQGIDSLLLLWSALSIAVFLPAFYLLSCQVVQWVMANFDETESSSPGGANAQETTHSFSTQFRWFHSICLSTSVNVIHFCKCYRAIRLYFRLF